MVTKGSTIYSWRYGAMTVQEVSNDYIFADIVQPQQVIVDKSRQDPLLTGSREWKVDGKTINADKCWRTDGMGFYVHERAIDAVINNQEITEEMASKVQPNTPLLPIDAGLLHPSLLKEYQKAQADIDAAIAEETAALDRKLAEKEELKNLLNEYERLTNQKYKYGTKEADALPYKQNAKAEIRDQDKFKKYCDDLDSCVKDLLIRVKTAMDIDSVADDIKRINAEKKTIRDRLMGRLERVKDSSYMVNFAG